MEPPDVAGLASSLFGATLRGSGEASNGSLDDADFLREECAICLDAVDEVDVALVKQCLHSFCTPCIIRWTTFQDDAFRGTANGGASGARGVAARASTCPCCKSPFDSLLIYRDLNGEVSRDLREESVCLLRRARWLFATKKDMAWENDHALALAAQHEYDVEHSSRRFGAPYEHGASLFEEEEDRRVAGFWSKGGKNKGHKKKASPGCGGSGSDRSGGIVIGNRRFGANGHIAQGRRTFARPVGETPPSDDDGIFSGEGKNVSKLKSQDSFGCSSAAVASSSSSSSSAAAAASSVSASPPPPPLGPPRVSQDEPEPTSSVSPGERMGARGKKAAKRAAAAAKKEEKDALRRAKRAENVAGSIARAKSKRNSGGAILESKLPDLSEVEEDEEDGNEIKTARVEGFVADGAVP